MSGSVVGISIIQPGDLSLQELIGLVKERVENMGFTKPDDDWRPMLFLLTMDGNVIVENVPDLFFQSKQTKAMLAEVWIPSRILKEKATAYALLLNAWMLKAQGKTKEEAREVARKMHVPDFSKHPDRVEVLIVEAGDAEGQTFSQAFIHRFADRPPTLSWNKEPMEKVETRFMSPISEALLKVKYPDRVAPKREPWKD